MPSILVLILLLALAALWTIYTALTVPSIARITVLPQWDDACHPPEKSTVAVIVPAKNEEQAIAETLTRLDKQTYKHLHIIAINDRSSDQTGNRMRDSQKLSERMDVIDIEELPAGWLGKNHALTLGAAKSTSEWILFTDADVHFAPTAVSRLVNYAETHALDHLVVSPYLLADTFWLRALIAFFLFNFILALRPQQASNPKSRAFMGMGACNFVRRQVYEAIGTHESIRMRPDEDIRLGQRIKQAGFRQMFVPASDFATVRWYDSVPAMARGLEKNALSLFWYSPLLLTVAMVPFLLVYLAPFVDLLLLRGSFWWLGLYTLGMMGLTYRATQRFSEYSSLLFLVVPVTASVFAVILLRAAWLTWRRGGMYWRGTFHSLRELRRSS